MREAETMKRIGLAMHKVADAITDVIEIPFVHIAGTTRKPSSAED